MTANSFGRKIALEAILKRAKEVGFDKLSDAQWNEIVTIAWDSQAIMDPEGRRNFRGQIKAVLETALSTLERGAE